MYIHSFGKYTRGIEKEEWISKASKFKEEKNVVQTE